VSSKAQPVCCAVRTWLKENLGKRALAPLTSTDSRALDSAVHILELWNSCDSKDKGAVMRAFAAVVRAMQPQCQYLVYHAIAQQMEWHSRDEVWALAGLEVIEDPGVCNYEPGGKLRYGKVVAA
jgi:hypothetical protein